MSGLPAASASAPDFMQIYLMVSFASGLLPMSYDETDTKQSGFRKVCQGKQQQRGRDETGAIQKK